MKIYLPFAQIACTGACKRWYRRRWICWGPDVQILWRNFGSRPRLHPSDYTSPCVPQNSTTELSAKEITKLITKQRKRERKKKNERHNDCWRNIKKDYFLSYVVILIFYSARIRESTFTSSVYSRLYSSFIIYINTGLRSGSGSGISAGRRSL